MRRLNDFPQEAQVSVTVVIFWDGEDIFGLFDGGEEGGVEMTGETGSESNTAVSGVTFT